MRKICMVVILAVTMTGTAAADLVTNGGFETGNFSGWTLTGAGCVGVAGSVGGLGCSGVDSDPGPHSGTKAAYLGPFDQVDTLSQNLATTAGGTYQINFWLANTGLNGETNPNSMLVLWDGNVILSLVNAPVFPYTLYSYQFTASSNSTQLQFDFNHNPAYYVLDDVSVQAVPEPASLVLLGTGLIGGIGAIRKRFLIGS